MSVPDHLDNYATFDATCKDGTTQRAEQVRDANGKFHLVVPADS